MENIFCLSMGDGGENWATWDERGATMNFSPLSGAQEWRVVDKYAR